MITITEETDLGAMEEFQDAAEEMEQTSEPPDVMTRTTPTITITEEADVGAIEELQDIAGEEMEQTSEEGEYENDESGEEVEEEESEEDESYEEAYGSTLGHSVFGKLIKEARTRMAWLKSPTIFRYFRGFDQRSSASPNQTQAQHFRGYI